MKETLSLNSLIPPSYLRYKKGPVLNLPAPPFHPLHFLSPLYVATPLLGKCFLGVVHQL